MKNLILIFLLAVLSSSCLEDERIVNPVEPLAKDKNVVLTMQIPGTYLPVTYAYSENEENDISTADALVFRIDASGNEYYYRHIAIPAISQDNGNIKKIQLRLEFIDSRVIVLANVGNLFTPEMNAQLRLDSIQGNVTKETVMKRFVFNMTEAFGKRKETFPMYGESEIIRSSDNVTGSVTMIRAIARIDIVNSILNDKVRIDSVYLFHTKNKGFVAPRFDSDGAILESPHVPGEAEANETALGYKFVQNAGVASPAMEREIYLTEDLQESEKPTIVVVKIQEEGRPPYFYRLDMLDKDGELLPVLRNYRYRISITKIISSGYLTPEEAAVMPKPSLSSTVETNELGITNVVFNDRFKLGTSTTNIVFNADGSWKDKKPGEEFYSLKVHTTYSGWSASWNKKEFAGWLSFPDAKEAETSVHFTSSALMLHMKASPNTTGEKRWGKIRLTAGALFLEINVTQYS
jgi:hypothetical protein